MTLRHGACRLIGGRIMLLPMAAIAIHPTAARLEVAPWRIKRRDLMRRRRERWTCVTFQLFGDSPVSVGEALWCVQLSKSGRAGRTCEITGKARVVMAGIRGQSPLEVLCSRAQA